MAILQALVSWLSRSAGKALNAIFGWAVIALFGRTSPKEQTLLSAVVAAAAAWPLLLLGVIVPKVALLVVAFVPLAKSAPGLWLRIVWIALALLVPIVVGAVVAKRGAQEHLPEPGWKRLLRGFPITLALALAFLLMLVVAPFVRIATVLRRRELMRVPALMERGRTAECMEALAGRLRSAGIELHPARAPFSLTAPSRILLRIGGRAFAGMASEKVEYREGGELSVAVLPNETVLRGKPAQVGRAHALCTEVYAPRPVTQTFAAEAREMESRVKRVWSIYLEQPDAHRRSVVLQGRVGELSAELAELNLPWDEWQILYRLLLQLDRALRGDRPLLEGAAGAGAGENEMADVEQKLLPEAAQGIQAMSNRQLVSSVIDSATLLAKKEIELAKTELKQDIQRELSMAKGLGVGALCAIWTVSLMLVACAMALGKVVPEWAAALIVAAAVLLVGTVAGVIGWKKRVTSPLESTRRSLKEDALWAKERLA